MITKLRVTANTGSKKIIRATSKIELVLVAELEFWIELEFNTSVELFKIAVEFKSNGIRYYKCYNYKKSPSSTISFKELSKETLK